MYAYTVRLLSTWGEYLVNFPSNESRKSFSCLEELKKLLTKVKQLLITKRVITFLNNISKAITVLTLW